MPELRPYCAPMMDKVQSPAYRWLWCRIKELEEYGEGIVDSHAIIGHITGCRAALHEAVAPSRRSDNQDKKQQGDYSAY